MTREELKSIVRDAPRIEATFADVDTEYQSKLAECTALKQRRDALEAQLAQVASARVELDEETTGEPAPAPSSAAKPKQRKG